YNPDEPSTAEHRRQTRNRLAIDYEIEVAREPGKWQVVASSQDRRRYNPDDPPEPLVPPGLPEGKQRAYRELVERRAQLLPQTARVLVNRVWQWHFGQGLVSTPSDFGYSGSPPTHPELLDWLADEFVRSGWKIKTLHRHIVLSAAYRQSGRLDARAMSVDRLN